MENMDINKMMGLMSMFGNDKKDMDIFGMLDAFLPNEKPNREYNKHNLFEDKYEERKEVKCLKSSVPYLQYNHQKNVLVLLKLFEIMELINIYNTTEKKKCENHDMYGLIDDILPHLDEKRQNEIKKCVNLLSLKERF